MAGVKYQCNPKTVVRAKVNSQGVLSACATNKCADKMSITVTSQVREKEDKHASKYVPSVGARCLSVEEEDSLGSVGRGVILNMLVLRAGKQEGFFFVV